MGTAKRIQLADLDLQQIKIQLTEDEQRSIIRRVILPMMDALTEIDAETVEGEYARRIVNGALGGAGCVDQGWRG